MKWLKELIAKLMFGRVLIKYMSNSISWQYKVGSKPSDSDASIFFQLETRGMVMGVQSSILNLFKISTAYFPCPMKKHSSLYQTSKPRK